MRVAPVQLELFHVICPECVADIPLAPQHVTAGWYQSHWMDYQQPKLSSHSLRICVRNMPKP